jgi:predicted transcriptional regulator YdeE
MKRKWRSILALALIILAILFQFYWIWALLFVLWVIPDLKSKTTYLMEPVSRKENPVLYWSIISCWIVCALLFFSYSLAPNLFSWGQEEYVYTTEKGETYKFDLSQHKPGTLAYKTHISETFYVVGLSAKVSLEEEEYESAVENLWERFYEEDLSTKIQDIVDDHLYFVHLREQQKIMLGYRTASLQFAKGNLDGTLIQAAEYAVFESNNSSTDSVAFLWEQILLSDLKSEGSQNIEVYSFNEDQNSSKMAIWVSLELLSGDTLMNTPEVEREVIFEGEEAIESAENPIGISEVVIYEEPKETFIQEDQTMVEAKKAGSFYVIGFQKRMNYEDDEAFQKSVEALWDQFFQKDYSRFIKDIEDLNDIYTVYSDYTKNEVTVTVGYRSASANYKTGKGITHISIGANEYMVDAMPISGSSSTTEEKEEFQELINYREKTSVDFEVYRFNDRYEIVSRVSWTSIK